MIWDWIWGNFEVKISYKVHYFREPKTDSCEHAHWLVFQEPCVICIIPSFVPAYVPQRNYRCQSYLLPNPSFIHKCKTCKLFKNSVIYTGDFIIHHVMNYPTNIPLGLSLLCSKICLLCFLAFPQFSAYYACFYAF